MAGESIPYGTKVPCEPCGQPTINTGTKRCNRCWELEKRISADPGLAVRFLGVIHDEVQFAIEGMTDEEAGQLVVDVTRRGSLATPQTRAHVGAMLLARLRREYVIKRAVREDR